MSRLQRILHLLPATVCEVAAIESISTASANANLQRLAEQGRAYKTDRQGERHKPRGPRPSIFDRTPTNERQNHG